MKRYLTTTVAASTLALMLGLMPSSAQEQRDPNAKPGGDIVITYKDDVSTLDPAIGYDWQNWSMIKSLFDGLMDYEPGTTTLRPELAESYETLAGRHDVHLQAALRREIPQWSRYDRRRRQVHARPRDQSQDAEPGIGFLRVDQRL